MRTIQSIICLCIFITNSSFAPKIKYSDGIIYKDGVVYFKSNWDNVIRLHEIRNIRDSLFLLLRNQMYIDRSLISNANKTGQVNYVEGKLPGKDTVLFEINAGGAKAKMKNLAKLFTKYNVIDSFGNINHSNMIRMSNDIGKTFSRRRGELRH